VRDSVAHLKRRSREAIERRRGRTQAIFSTPFRSKIKNYDAPHLKGKKTCVYKHRSNSQHLDKIALDTLRFGAKKCSICGYSEYPEILQIHHKDKNPHNNQRYNLIVLCPNCHYLVHRDLKECP
jgi:5-methylcytosine-specific restriction endonuclease McrA